MLADDRRALKEWGYVTLSRAREQTRLYTIESELEPDAPPHRIEAAAPVDRLAEALSRPAAETLALDAIRSDSRGLPDRTRLALESRRLRERQHALEKERFEASSELRRTGRTLENMGALRRARHGPTLRGRIEARNREVARLDKELERLEERRLLTRERALELASRERQPERGVARERGIGRSLERERSLDRGIEL